jgi:hypothetical protein
LAGRGNLSLRNIGEKRQETQYKATAMYFSDLVQDEEKEERLS